MIYLDPSNRRWEVRRLPSVILLSGRSPCLMHPSGFILNKALLIVIGCQSRKDDGDRLGVGGLSRAGQRQLDGRGHIGDGDRPPLARNAGQKLVSVDSPADGLVLPK